MKSSDPGSSQKNNLTDSKPTQLLKCLYPLPSEFSATKAFLPTLPMEILPAEAAVADKN